MSRDSRGQLASCSKLPSVPCKEGSAMLCSVRLFLFICRVVFIVVNLYTFCTQVKYVASSIKSWRELESSVLRQVSQLEMNKRGEHWKKKTLDGDELKSLIIWGGLKWKKYVSSSCLVLLSTIKSLSLFCIKVSKVKFFVLHVAVYKLYAVWREEGGG